MNNMETNEHVSNLGMAWEQYKQVNDARLSDAERKGYADPLYDEHMHNLSLAMEGYKERLDRLETVNSRPALAVEPETKSNDRNSPYAKAFRNYLRKGMDAGLEALQTKALSVTSDPDGGYLVTP